MTPLLRRFLWRTVYGDTWRALGISTRKPNGRVVITTCKGTGIENVHLEADPGWHPAGNYLRVFGPHGDVWDIGPILSARSLPAPDVSLQQGREDIEPVTPAGGERYARHFCVEGRDDAFLPAWNEARDIDTVVWTPDSIPPEIDEVPVDMDLLPPDDGRRPEGQKRKHVGCVTSGKSFCRQGNPAESELIQGLHVGMAKFACPACHPGSLHVSPKVDQYVLTSGREHKTKKGDEKNMTSTPHTTEEQKTIEADTLAAIHRTHPIEAAVWDRWIRRGQARVIEVSE